MSKKKYIGSIIRYNNKPEMGGEAFGPFISIKPKYKDDEGLHVHEYEHVKQWYMWIAIFGVLGIATFFLTLFPPLALTVAGFGLVAHNFLYNVIKPYAKWCEIRCYNKQLDCYPWGNTLAGIEFAVQALMKKYSFKMTRKEATDALMKGRK